MTPEVRAFMDRYETGRVMSELEFIDGFQLILDAGVLPELPRDYQRVAEALLNTGRLERREV